MSAAEMQIIELAALRGRAADLRAIAATHAIVLPEMGRAIVSGEHTTLCVRPNRWIVASSAAIDWWSSCEGVAIAVDLSSALTPFRINDSAAYTRLVSGSRVDLSHGVFPEASATATIIAQVQVILARLPNELLVLTPSTTARHFQEWLGERHS